MLGLTRAAGEAIMIGDRIIVTVLEVKGDKIRFGINAPDDIRVRRAEMVEPKDSSNA